MQKYKQINKFVIFELHFLSHKSKLARVKIITTSYYSMLHRNSKQILCSSASKLIPAYRNNLSGDYIALRVYLSLLYLSCNILKRMYYL